MPATQPRTILQRWQWRTAASLFVGYGAYYLCRSNLAVAAPLLIREFGGRGLNSTLAGCETGSQDVNLGNGLADY